MKDLAIQLEDRPGALAEMGAALGSAGITVLAEKKVFVQRLAQDQPGQIGKLTRRMAEAGVNIQVILVVDDLEKGEAVSEAWTKSSGIS